MPDTEDWSFPEELQPRPGQTEFDLDAVLDTVVSIRAEIPEDAFSAAILGTERIGNGVVIREDGVILTIGYLITEAQVVWVTTNHGLVVSAHPLAYDQITGFGLLQTLGEVGTPALGHSSTSNCTVGDDLLLIGQGGRRHALRTTLVDKREFAGSWEYLLDEALFTSPAHPRWSGAALVGEDGRLLGIGSLLVQQALEREELQCNMSVPIDLLEPILDNLLTTGRSGVAPRPWLGMYTSESEERLVVAGLAEGGPAAAAGIRQGDLVLEVAGTPVTTLAQLFRGIWQLGPPGVKVPLTLSRAGHLLTFEPHAIDRQALLKGPQLH